MTDKARALAHEAIGCECKMYSGKHDDICDRIQSALAAARNETLEQLAKHAETEAHSWRQHNTITMTVRAETLQDFANHCRALKDRP